MPARLSRLIAVALFLAVGILLVGGCSMQRHARGKLEAGPARAAGESPEAMIAGAKSVDAAFLAGFNGRDLAAVSAAYWDSGELVVYLPGEMECRGWQAAHDAFAKLFEQLPADMRLEMIDPQYMVAGPYVIGYGRWKLTDPTGTPTLGRFTAVFGKKDGKWVYVADHASQPVP